MYGVYSPTGTNPHWGFWNLPTSYWNMLGVQYSACRFWIFLHCRIPLWLFQGSCSMLYLIYEWICFLFVSKRYKRIGIATQRRWTVWWRKRSDSMWSGPYKSCQDLLMVMENRVQILSSRSRSFWRVTRLDSVYIYPMFLYISFIDRLIEQKDHGKIDYIKWRRCPLWREIFTENCTHLTGYFSFKTFRLNLLPP